MGSSFELLFISLIFLSVSCLSMAANILQQQDMLAHKHYDPDNTEILILGKSYWSTHIRNDVSNRPSALTKFH